MASNGGGIGTYWGEVRSIGETVKKSGQTSGITARVGDFITDEVSTRGTYTLYVDYIESSSTDSSTETFFNNEVLETN